MRREGEERGEKGKEKGERGRGKGKGKGKGERGKGKGKGRGRGRGERGAGRDTPTVSNIGMYLCRHHQNNCHYTDLRYTPNHNGLVHRYYKVKENMQVQE